MAGAGTHLTYYYDAERKLLAPGITSANRIVDLNTPLLSKAVITWNSSYSTLVMGLSVL